MKREYLMDLAKGLEPVRWMCREDQIVKLIVVFDAKQRPVFQWAHAAPICPFRSSRTGGISVGITYTLWKVSPVPLQNYDVRRNVPKNQDTVLMMGYRGSMTVI